MDKKNSFKKLFVPTTIKLKALMARPLKKILFFVASLRKPIKYLFAPIIGKNFSADGARELIFVFIKFCFFPTSFTVV